MPLLGPDGREISTVNFRKAEKPILGPSFGDWAGRDVLWSQMPGGAVLQFDLDGLTLADFRAMKQHPQINASLSVMSFIIHQCDWHIECKDKKIADDIDRMLRIVWTRMMRAMSQAFWAGYSPIALEFDNDIENKQVVITKFKDLIPEDCRVNWKIVEGAVSPTPLYGVPSVGDQLSVLSPDMSSNTVGPYSQIKPKFREYNGISQFGSPAPIPPDYTLWYPLLMENGNYWGRKLLKAAFTPWYFSTLIHLFANRYFERFGEPTPIGRAPLDETFPDPEDATGTKEISAKTAMERIIQNLRNRSVVVLPSDREQVGNMGQSAYTYDLQYLESQMRGADFERYLSRLDEEMSLSMFTPLLLLRNSDMGSHNLGVQHVQTWLWMLNSITADMKEYIDRFVISRLKAYNWSPNAPHAEWVPHKMGKQNPGLLQAVLTSLITSGTTGVDLDELGQAVGLSLHQIDVLSGVNGPDQPPSPEDGSPVSAPGGSRGGQPQPRPVRPGRGPGNPRGVAEPRATGRQITARIKAQVEKAWRENRFTNLNFSLGHNQRFTQSLMAEGFAADEAESMTREFYNKMELWVNDVVQMGQSQFSGPADFMALFERHMDNAIEDLVA